MPRPVFFPQGQNEWLLGIGQRLRAEYDVVLAAPLPPRREFVIRGASVLTMDPNIRDFGTGDVLVRDGLIGAVGSRS